MAMLLISYSPLSNPGSKDVPARGHPSSQDAQLAAPVPGVQQLSTIGLAIITGQMRTQFLQQRALGGGSAVPACSILSRGGGRSAGTLDTECLRSVSYPQRDMPHFNSSKMDMISACLKNNNTPTD